MSEIQQTLRGNNETKDDQAQAIEVSPETESNPESDAIRTENEQLKKALKMAETKAEAISHFKSAGAKSPELLFETVKSEFEFDKGGKAKNIVAIAERLAQQYPEQFVSARQAVPSIDGATATARATIVVTKEMLAKMKPEEIKTLNWQEIRNVLRQN